MSLAGPQIKTQSKTVTDTIVGEHQHCIVGYSLVKGIGDGEPIASERFLVGGHEWVLLFYPDGKRSSSSEGHLGGAGGGAEHGPQQLMIPVAPVPPVPPLPPAPAAGALPPPVQPPPAEGPGHAAEAAGGGAPAAAAVGAAAPPAAPAAAAAAGGAPALAGNHAGGHGAPHPHAHHHHAVPVILQQMALQRQQRRDTTNEYAALFVALIGEGPNPLGVVNTTEGKVVRAFHRFTLVDQTGQGRDLTKGRTREAGAVKISCARQDPNARNCHGYRKFVKRSILEDPQRGFLVNDTIIIKYTIELVVSSGGALSRNSSSRNELVKVPPPCLGADLKELLNSGNGADCTVVVEEEEMKAHKIILEARSPFFAALLNSPMREGQEGRVVIHDIKAPVFRMLLHFVYTDTLPEEQDGTTLDVCMAQHLLAAADLYQLIRLRRICERRLCDTVDTETVATTLTLAEQNHADELKKVCLDYVARNLGAVMNTDGYRHMTRSCPQLQAEILSTIATSGSSYERGHGPAIGGGAANPAAGHRTHGTVRVREHPAPEEEGRRLRPRRE